MFERFTDRARRCLVLAQELAHEHNHTFIGTEHLLYGLAAEGAEEEHGVARTILAEMDVDAALIEKRISEIVGDGEPPPISNPPFTPRSKKVLELGLREALQLGHSYIGTEHLLLGLIREGEGVGATILAEAGATLSDVRAAIITKIQGYTPDPPPPEPAPAPLLALRDDAARATALAALVDSRVISRNEARQALGLPPVDGWDDFV